MRSSMFVRQELCVPENKMEEHTFAVVGVGSVGREIAMELASMGAKQIHLFDFDAVEERNLVNQHYHGNDIGVLKVIACRRAMFDVAITGGDGVLCVHPHDTRFSDIHATSIKPTVLFCAVDNIDSRKVIYNNWLNIDCENKILIDSRVGGETFRIINVLRGDTHYESELFPENETFDGPCAEQLTIYMSRITAGFAVAQMAMWFREFPLDKMININVIGSDVDRG